jgi:integrase/recombinase XerD
MKESSIHFLSNEEVTRLLGVIGSKRDKALFLLAYRHGLRASEMGRLRVEDIDFERRVMKIDRVKGSHGGEYPLASDELKALNAYLHCREAESPFIFVSRLDKPISRKTLEWLMKRYGAAANLPSHCRHFHVLKHSIAVHLFRDGRSRDYVHHWLGHVKFQNTDLYTHLKGSNWRSKKENRGSNTQSRVDE